MNDYYISEAKRHRILLPLQQKVYNYCIPSSKTHLYNKNSLDEEIEGYVLSIFTRFRMNGADLCSPILTPVDPSSLMSRRMSTFVAETPPCIFICAADIFALYTCLLPHRRSPSPETVPLFLSRHRSTGSTGSSRSSGFKASRSSRIIFDIGGSILDDEHIGHATDNWHQKVGARGVGAGHELARSSSHDDNIEGRFLHELRLAIYDLSEHCNTEASSEAISDCWEQLFVYPESIEPENRSLIPEDVRAEPSDCVRRAICHLVDNFEFMITSMRTIPASDPACYFTMPRHAHSSAQNDSTLRGSKTGDGPTLLQYLHLAAQHCFARGEYSTSDTYYRAHNELQASSQGTMHMVKDFSIVLQGACAEQNRVIDGCERRSQTRMALTAHATDHRESLLQAIDNEIQHLNKIRLKMWYACDVRNSKMWNQAWDVIKCLYRMKPNILCSSDGQPIRIAQQDCISTPARPRRPTALSRSNSKDRRFPRFSRDNRMVNSSTNHLSGIQTHDQGLLEVLSAPVCQGGPNKLSTIESRQTLQWLREGDIHNFCKGEERLHRLCHEVDDLNCRILGTTNTSTGVLEADEAHASALWQYDLFEYECNILEVRKASPDISITTRGGVFQSDDNTTTFSSLLRRGSANDLLSLPKTASRTRGNSVGSLDNPRHRSRTVSSIIPVKTILDLPLPISPATTAGDFGTHRLYRQTSALSGHQSTSSSVEYDDQAVLDFLLQTQLGLTALLVSDFAEMIFSRGSETDEWINDDLVEVSIRGKLERTLRIQETETNIKHLQSAVEAGEKELTKRAARSEMHHRTKSTNLSLFFSSSNTVGNNQFKSAPAPPSIDIAWLKESQGANMERTRSSDSYLDMVGSTSLSRAPTAPIRQSRAKDNHLRPFPLIKAYKEILQRFSVHPSPYEKLRALYEFELLVVSNLSTGKQETIPISVLTSMPQTPLVTSGKNKHNLVPASLRQHNRKDSEDLARIRIEKLAISSLVPEPALRSSLGQRDFDKHSPGTDTIVEEIQKLFHVADLRPKTLFRDLQYIASFIPTHILNMTDEGKVFWDIGLAALGYKKDSLEAMLDFAGEITSKVCTASSDLANHEPSILDSSTIADAAKIFTICAQEGDVRGMRELAMLQSTDSPYVDPIIPPFSEPSDVFRALNSVPRTAEAIYAGLAKIEAAKAWFELAASYGDQVSQARTRNGIGASI